MNILLLNPKLKTWSPNFYVPLGLTYIAAVLEQAGYQVEIIDLNMQKVKDIIFREKVNGADVVGITGMITEYSEIVRLVSSIKKIQPETTVILGGPLATTLPLELLQVTQTDFIVLGEGEKTIINLLSTIKNKNGYENIKGIAYRKNGVFILNDAVEPIEDMDTIPFPARHLLNIERYLGNQFQSFGIDVKELGRVKCTNMVSSRGCPYNCTFCFKDMWGNRWRARSPQNMIEEIEELHNDYGVNGFFFNDDTFVLDKQRVFDFCNLIREKEIKIAWYCNGRVNLMTRELLTAMYDAGCLGIAYGIESGNQKILDSIKKQINLDQVRKVVKWTKEAGIHVTGYFMLGILGETRATIRETIDFARELDLDFHGFSLTTPIPGTELYESSIGAGLISGNSTALGEWSQHANANLTSDCSDSDLTAFASKVFKEFYLQKRYGKYYYLNPTLWKEELKVLSSLRHTDQAKELFNKSISLLRSYWHRG